MTTQNKAQLVELLKLVTALASVIGVILLVYDWVASKKYVASSTEPIAADVRQILAINIADQISTLHRYNCLNPDDPSFLSLMREKKLKYEELTGKEFQEAECERVVIGPPK